jgi:hypothetical protein
MAVSIPSSSSLHLASSGIKLASRRAVRTVLRTVIATRLMVPVESIRELERIVLPG